MTGGHARYTRTINPLQFDALEPRRFEDLVRQLLYDFKPWRQLEATGRSGSDDGFDARGWEIPDAVYTDADNEDSSPPLVEDRVWLVQCKREKQIGPSKLKGYLTDIPENERAHLYGVVLAAPADFSKKARDEFRVWCADHGIRECHLWGRGELEDMLFQPKNDNLLFAYFGLSLTIRRRSLQANVRARTSIKRKLKRALEAGHQAVLVRDIEDDEYPYKAADRDDFRWWVCQRPMLTHRGLEFSLSRFFAYADDDQEHWDFANVLNDAVAWGHVDPWRGTDTVRPVRAAIMRHWEQFEERNRAWAETYGVISLDDILEVDEIGDEITRHPHIFVRCPDTRKDGPATSFRSVVTGIGFDKIEVIPTPATRVERFPDHLRKPLVQR